MRLGGRAFPTTFVIFSKESHIEDARLVLDINQRNFAFVDDPVIKYPFLREEPTDDELQEIFRDMQVPPLIEQIEIDNIRTFSAPSPARITFSSLQLRAEKQGTFPIEKKRKPFVIRTVSSYALGATPLQGEGTNELPIIRCPQEPTSYEVYDAQHPEASLGVYHTSQLTPFQENTAPTPAPLAPIRKRGRPRKKVQDH